MSEITDRKSGSRWRLSPIWYLGLIAAALIVATLIYFGYRSGLNASLTLDAVRQAIRSWGAWGVAASVALMMIHSFVPFPAEVVAFANGMIYGPIWGTVITWIGAMLGAYLAFGLARFFGRPLVVRLLSPKKLEALDHWTARYAGRLLLVSRFLPFIAFNLINYAAGLTRVSWLTFGWTTGLGILPLTIFMVMFGDRAERMSWEAWLLIGAGLVAALLLLNRPVLRLLGFHRRPRRD